MTSPVTVLRSVSCFSLGSQEELARLAESPQWWRLPFIKPRQGNTVGEKGVVGDNN